jgi:hypothetical protein
MEAAVSGQVDALAALLGNPVVWLVVGVPRAALTAGHASS